MQPMTRPMKPPSVPALLLSGICFLCFHHAYGEDGGAKPSPAAAAQHGEAPSAQTEMPENKDTPASLDAATGGKAGATKAPGNNDVPAASEKKPRAEWTHITFPEVVQNECADFYPPEDIYDVMLQLYNHLDYPCLYDPRTNNLEALMKIPVINVTDIVAREDKRMPGKIKYLDDYQGEFFLRLVEAGEHDRIVTIDPFISPVFYKKGGNIFANKERIKILPKPDEIHDFKKYPGTIPIHPFESEEEEKAFYKAQKKDILGGRDNPITNDKYADVFDTRTNYHWYKGTARLYLMVGEETYRISFIANGPSIKSDSSSIK